MLEILENEKLRNSLRKKGLERAKNFSWEKCAKETLDWMKIVEYEAVPRLYSFIKIFSAPMRRGTEMAITTAISQTCIL